VSYLALGIPAVIGGIATSQYGLHDTALVYSVVVAALVAVALGLLMRLQGQRTHRYRREKVKNTDSAFGVLVSSPEGAPE
jgi:hypothetical protein